MKPDKKIRTGQIRPDCQIHSLCLLQGGDGGVGGCTDMQLRRHESSTRSRLHSVGPGTLFYLQATLNRAPAIAMHCTLSGCE